MSGRGSRKVDATGRSDTKLKMHGKRGERRIGEQFIAHKREMRLSVAWKCLTGNDKLLLERIEEEHMAHGGTENGKLRVTYRDFAEAGIRRGSISTALARVEALGFVECTDRGRAARAEFRFPASYRLTYVQGNLPPTDDWKGVISPEDAEQRVALALKDLSARASLLRQKLKEKASETHGERKVA